MRAVVFQHEEHEGVGLLGPVLEEAGFTLVNRFRAVRREDVDADLVVVMGGPMGVYEAEQHPFLHDELALLTERLANERPCLGICLGAQLLASAAGAEVFLGKNGFEVGVAPVRWTPEALKDPVIAGVRPKTVVACRRFASACSRCTTRAAPVRCSPGGRSGKGCRGWRDPAPWRRSPRQPVLCTTHRDLRWRCA